MQGEWWYASSPRYTIAVRVLDERVVEGPPCVRRFLGQSPKRVGDWLRSHGSVRFERMPKTQAEKRSWTERVSAALPESGRRHKSRDPEEARLLIERGTPARLVGPTHVFMWGNNPRRAELKGRACTIMVRGTTMRSVLVEFENGEQVICSYRALKQLR